MFFQIVSNRFYRIGFLTAVTAGLSGVLLAYLLSLSLSVPFTSDDYIHLFQDASSPWHYSSDHLFRPLRNGLFKLLAHEFGANLVLYRLCTCVLYVVDSILVGVLMLSLGGCFRGAVFSSAVFAFFPRNHAVLF